MSACEDEQGMPNHHVNRFQAMAPSNAAMTTASVVVSTSTRPAPMVLADSRSGEGTGEVHRRRHEHGRPRPQRLRGHRGGDGVGLIVEAVDVVEEDGQDDDEQQRQRQGIEHLVPLDPRWRASGRPPAPLTSPAGDLSQEWSSVRLGRRLGRRVLDGAGRGVVDTGAADAAGIRHLGRNGRDIVGHDEREDARLVGSRAPVRASPASDLCHSLRSLPSTPPTTPAPTAPAMRVGGKKMASTTPPTAPHLTPVLVLWSVIFWILTLPASSVLMTSTPSMPRPPATSAS